jgi:hypothetical protein
LKAIVEIFGLGTAKRKKKDLKSIFHFSRHVFTSKLEEGLNYLSAFKI